jgi:hypothetical protein
MIVFSMITRLYVQANIYVLENIEYRENVILDDLSTYCLDDSILFFLGEKRYRRIFNMT